MLSYRNLLKHMLRPTRLVRAKEGHPVCKLSALTTPSEFK